jgi:hypothetical protein
MSKKFFQGNRITSLISVDCQEELEPLPGININPPPEDGRCHCCGRHISELNPFGGPGDPLVGDFTGALLVKMFRRFGPYDEEADKAFQEAESRYKEEGFENEFDYLIHKHGPEKGEELNLRISAYCQTGSSWECRDCAVLDENEYFEKYDQGKKG